jgi:hypothetical protein
MQEDVRCVDAVPSGPGATAPERRQEDSAILVSIGLSSVTPFIPRSMHTLGHLDLDGFRFRLLGFREMHVEHPVFVVRRHPAPIRIFRK